MLDTTAWPQCIFKTNTHNCNSTATHTHTHPFNGPFSRTTRVSRYQKGKTNLDFTEARDSEWQWHQLGHMQICTSLQTNNHASNPPPSFLQAGCPSCRPTNSVKALKAQQYCKNSDISQTGYWYLCVSGTDVTVFLLRHCAVLSFHFSVHDNLFYVDLVFTSYVIDEMHHSASVGWRQIINSTMSSKYKNCDNLSTLSS